MRNTLSEKRKKGQYLTTKSDYILEGFEKFIDMKEVVDPFAGNGDLLKWASKNGAINTIGYDIDKKFINNINIFKRDSLLTSNKYKFVITNPPYLYKNKADIKVKTKYFNKFPEFDDLFQISIFSILNSQEGIIIIPLNFLSAENTRKIRTIFFNKFEIIKLNIFQEQVFEDTTYNVISFYYKKRKNYKSNNVIKTRIFPARKETVTIINKNYGYKVGGKYFDKIKKYNNNLKIKRLTLDMIQKGEKKATFSYNSFNQKIKIKIDEKLYRKIANNIILLRSIDRKNNQSLGLYDIREESDIVLIGKKTSRNMAHLIIGNKLSIKIQLKIIEEVNKELTTIRHRYSSFFLTNFRDNNRKRISFDFMYNLINYIYYTRIMRGKNE